MTAKAIRCQNTHVHGLGELRMRPGVSDLLRTACLLVFVMAVTGLAYSLRRPQPEWHPADLRVVIAVITEIDGSIQVKRAGTLEWTEANVPTKLWENDLIRAGDHAKATILFPDGSRFNVGPNSLQVIAPGPGPRTSFRFP